MLKETCKWSLTQLGKLTHYLFSQESTFAGPEVWRYEAESSKSKERSILLSVAYLHSHVCLVNKDHSALLWIPSGFPKCLWGQPDICYTDIRTLCWHTRRSTGGWIMFLPVQECRQHSCLLPRLFDNIYPKLLDDSVHRKIRYQEAFSGLERQRSTCKINTVMVYPLP